MDFNKIFIDVGEEVLTSETEKIRTQIIEGFQQIPLITTQGAYVIPKEDLFVPEGNKLHGASKIDETYVEIHQLFSELPQNKIFYSIVNRNTAHQMSYFLAQYAFEKFGKQGNEKIVINIDQHVDYAAEVSEPVKFSCWGRNILSGKFLETLSNKATYNVIGIPVVKMEEGEPVKKEINVLIKTINLSVFPTAISSSDNNENNKKKKKESKEENKLQITDINLAKKTIELIFEQKIKEGISSTNKSDIYISFDTDAMKKSNTLYESGILEVAQVLEMIQKIFNIIKTYGDRLVGIDVTGLPIRDGIKNTYDCDTYDGAFENTKKIINDIEHELISFNL